jgi:hypothetical protein
VIVGGDIAGGNAAATLREEGFAGPVVLISAEPGVLFGRPPLSKTYLRSEEDPYDYLHTFWSDQYEHKIEYVGHVATWDEFVVRGSLDEAKLVGFYLVDGAVKAAVGLDRGGDPELCGRRGQPGTLPAGRRRPRNRHRACRAADRRQRRTRSRSSRRCCGNWTSTTRWPGTSLPPTSATTSAPTRSSSVRACWRTTRLHGQAEHPKLWAEPGALSMAEVSGQHETRGEGHGRRERRIIQVMNAADHIRQRFPTPGRSPSSSGTSPGPCE